MTPAIALDPLRPLTQYQRAAWQDRDGLPQNTVQAIVQTRDGYLWLGTEAGLARFDGVKFTVFEPGNTSQLRHGNITALCEARDGSLWIGTRGGGVIRYRAGRFDVFTQADGLATDSIRALTEDAQGALWVGTNDGLSRLSNGGWQSFKQGNGLAGEGIRALCADQQGRVWIGTTDGLSCLVDGRFVSYAQRPDAPPGIIRALTIDGAGALWVGTQNHGLARLQEGRWESRFEFFTERDGLPTRLIRSLTTDRDGNVWIGTFGGGLARWHAGKFATLAQLSSNIVRSLYEDREGNLWVGTEGGGVQRLTNGKVITLSTRDGLPHDFIRAVREDTQGRVWIGTEGGGLSVWQNGVVRNFTTRDGLSSEFITALHEDAAGRIWVGTLLGLNRFENGRFVTIALPDNRPDFAVWVIAPSRDGSLWLGTPNGLYRWRAKPEGRTERFATAEQMTRGNVRVLHEDRAGRLFIGLREGGLVKMEQGKFTLLKFPATAATANVASFHEDESGTLWICTNQGLLRYANEQFAALTKREGLFHNNLIRLLAEKPAEKPDDGQRFWLSSSGGIFAVNRDELNAVAAGQVARVNVMAFTAADGMQSSECAGEAQPAGWRLRNGQMWFPTIKGVAIIEPQAIRTNPLPPPVLLEQVLVEQQSLTMAVTMSNALQLAAGTRELEFRYTALSFAAPERVRFKYKLEGLEQDWVEAGTRRTAFYTSLPPGAYRFRVQASNNDGVWNETGAEFAFMQQPYFYQRPLFYALLIGALGALGYAFYRYRVRQLQQQFAAVSTERNRIAREWHDTLVAGIAAINWQLEALAGQLPEAAATAQTQLEIARKMAKHSLTEARRALWELRTNPVESGDFVTRLAIVVRQQAAGKAVAAEVQVSGEPARLAGEIETNLLRIGQEAVSNALQHAAAQSVTVALQFAPHALTLRVSDDGCGFDTQADTTHGGHFGLTGMRERAVKLGGTFTLHSQPNAGTQIIVTVPLTNGTGKA